MQEQFVTILQNLFKKYIINRWYLFLPAFLLFAYVAFRAMQLSLIWDEANTFFEHVRTPFWLPNNYNYMSANNHLLNTWLMKCSVNVFGESEFALRLPNVIAAGFYFVFIAAILEKLFEKRWQILLAFLIVTLNPFVLDFFSVARGYGISLTLLMGGMWQITNYIFAQHKLRYGIYAQLFLIAATLANLTLIHVLFVVTFLLILSRFIFNRSTHPIRTSFTLTFLPTAAVLALLPHLNKLKIAGALFYGDEAKSLWDTVLSLSLGSFYGTTYSSPLAPAFAMAILLTGLICVIFLVRNSTTAMKTNQGKWAVTVVAILIFCLASPTLMHLTVKTNYLFGRTALFYLPLFTLSFIGLILVFPKNIKTSILIVFAIILAFHFIFSGNISSYYDWREQADVKNAMKNLKKQSVPEGQKVYAQVITTDLPFEKQINYYRMRYGMANFSHAARKENIPNCSFCYLQTPINFKMNSKDSLLSYFGNTQTSLFRSGAYKIDNFKCLVQVWQDFEKEDPYLELKTDTIYFGNKGTFAGDKHEFSISVPLTIPDSINENIFVSLNCRLYYYTRNTSALLVLAFDNGSSESWEAMHLTELSEKPGEWSLTNWTRPVPVGTKKVRAYIWNRDETIVLMDNVGIRLLSSSL